MILAKIRVTGVRAILEDANDIPAGIIGGKVRMEYADPLWDGLSKTVVFRGRQITKDVLNAGDLVNIPPEITARPGDSLFVGVYGTDVNGNIAIPTLWADLGRVRAAADPSGDASTDEGLPVWAQLQEQIDDLRENGPSSGGNAGSDVSEAMVRQAISQHNASDDAHGDIRLELKSVRDRLTAFFDSDDQTLDELSEIVAYITSNKDLIDAITTSKVSVSDIVDNLTSDVKNRPLSAAQGVKLKSLVDALSTSLDSYQLKGDYLKREELPTGAKVGQIIKIAEVDVQGVPRKWEAVDLSASGGNVDQVGVEPMDGDLPKVFLTGEAFSDMTAEKNEVLMGMEYISKTDRFKGAIKIKWQGSSSVSNTNFLRKNFTVKLYVDDTYADKLKKTFKDWGVEENKWVLKSNWIDITASRNIVSARLWDQIVSTRADYASLPEEIRNSPRNCEVDGFPIKLYANGVYEGIYTWNIPKDGFMFNMDEDNRNHAVLCAEKNNDVGTLSSDAISSCEFRKEAKIDGSDWSLEFPDDLQTGIKTSFNNLIRFVMTASDSEFTANLDNYLDVQSAIDYYIFAYLNCGTDSLGKNLIMMTYNGVKWYASQYDMDSTWGLHFAGSRLYESTMKCPEEYQENNSLLWQRIVNCFAQRLQDRYFELRKTVLSETNIINEFERFIDAIPYEIREEEKNLEAYTTRPLKYTNNIQQIRSFVVSRAVYVDEQFRNIVPIMPTGITLDHSSLTVALDGTATLKATIVPEDATSKAVVWTSNNNAVATVVDGVVSGVSVGSAVITATTTNGLSASCAITVEAVEIPVTGLSFAETEISVNMEETAQYQLAVAYMPANTTQKDVVWASNNQSVATVENGLVTFVAKGNATITANSVDNPSVVASCVFTVEGSNMIDYYFCGADRMQAGGNNVTTYSAYESAGFCNGIVEFPTKNSEKAVIECDVLEVVPDNQKRTAEKSIIAGFNNGTTNYLSMKFPVADIPANSVTALYTYLHNNPIHAKFKMCEGVKEYDIPLTGWTRNIQSEAGFKYYFTLNIDSTIASAIESSASKRTSIGELVVNATQQGQTEYRHAITLSGGVLELRIPFTGAEQTVEDAMAYLSQFGTPKIYYV